MKRIKKYIQYCFILVLVMLFGLSIIDTQEITYKTNYDYNLIETHIENLLKMDYVQLLILKPIKKHLNIL